MIACVLATPVSAKVSVLMAQVTPISISVDPTSLMQQSRDLYERGLFEQAVDVLRQASQAYAAEGDALHQALALSNLSLTYQQLGLWTEANQTINESLALLENQPVNEQTASVLAQTLDIQGRFYFAQGQAEPALEAWQQASATYETIGDVSGAVAVQINQAQALQALGLYRRSIDLLNNITQHLSSQPAVLTRAVALRSLAEALLVTGNFPDARQALEKSLEIAQQSQSDAAPAAIAAAYLGLGNLTRSEASANLNYAGLTIAEALSLLEATDRPPPDLTEVALQQRSKAAAQAFYEQTTTALYWYQQAANHSASDSTRIQAQLKQFDLLVETQRWEQMQILYPQIQTQLNAQPLSHSHVYNQIELAQSLLKLRSHSLMPQAIVQLLATAHQQAITLQDSRAQSYTLGTLGKLYEITAQLPEAQRLTQQALTLSQSLNAGDISYQWQWQLGRLLKVQGQTDGAIQSYRAAVGTLQSLRNDLVAINRDVQFSFRERVEPVYRELVSLLLESNTSSTDLEKLVQARDVIEGLQVAELDNFFREACLDTQFQLDRVVDQANSSAAIFYTIVLPDRLEVILKLPQRPLFHYSTAVSQETVEDTVSTLLNELKRPIATRSLKTLSQQMYDWLIRPAESVLRESDISTLVFVLDGALRNVPMSALYDGQQYLMEKYGVAIAPGLQLPEPGRLQQHQVQALVVGLSEARNSFPALSNVATEIEEIKADVPSRVLFNQDFTRSNFQQAITSVPFSIVHIATHGQFSSNVAETFILAWDEPIDVNELTAVLQSREIMSPEPIELLVLSACQTAVGDRRATLGLAGVAVRAGARSTVASLWNLDDDSGAIFMSRFYEELVNASISKAEALRRAQQSLLTDPQYQAPRFWAPYVLLGNWL
ncbi:CHAT domain-containing protein [Leptolyngbya sp. FACHB-541]|uniref:CHAT domain-containing protein n=1 Tax=Leptolyngbya sp. FACHB-541 TaxID=2692810 RepID=UPI0018F04FF1|nr:CHAT domain-containing protein [Leptolyngbya sp. FACHB-541]